MADSKTINNTGTSPSSTNKGNDWGWSLARGIAELAGTTTGSSSGITSQMTPAMQALLDSLTKSAATNTVATEKAVNPADYTKQKANENVVKLLTGFYQGADASGVTDLFKAIAPDGAFSSNYIADAKARMVSDTAAQAALARQEDYAKIGISAQNAQLQQLLSALQLQKGAVTVQESNRDTPLNSIGGAISDVFKSIF